MRDVKSPTYASRCKIMTKVPYSVAEALTGYSKRRNLASYDVLSFGAGEP